MRERGKGAGEEEQAISPQPSSPCHGRMHFFSEKSRNSEKIWEILRKSENFSDFLKLFQIIWKFFRLSENFSDYLKKFQIFSEINPKSVGDFSVTSEVDSESLNTLRKNIFKRSPCKSLGPWPLSCAKTTKCQIQKIWKYFRKSEKFSENLKNSQKIWKYFRKSENCFLPF